ncbi:leucine-rich repeat protein [Candidatus Clostridium radicumherbarum]|uniref:Leucine-rich repeat protein n=1 Tax=Candidatus Clostridium radicumherbarum TaxID=3381662 RepID=A0ABW8TY05_9CLOT
MNNRKMKMLSLMLVLTILIVSFNFMPVLAATTGTDANGFTWQSDDGVTYSITGYNGSDTNITIPSSIDGHAVTSIGNNAFNGNNDIRYQSLTSVTIPNTVTSIGGFAFYYCSSLVNISIPDSVTSIGDSAFAYCTSITNIKLPANLSSIGNSTFQDLKALTGITIPNSVKSIGSYAFLENFSLTNITIPNSVTYIGEGAFKDCKNLKTAEMPDSVISVGNYLFYNDQLLSNVRLPNNLTNTGDSIFYNNFSLTGVTLPSSLTNIGNSAFENCTALTNITIPKGVVRIGYRAFEMCKVLQNVTIPNTVKIIDFNAFAHNYAFTNIVIPDSVTSIGDYAFYYCTSLTEITIPKSVTSIGFLTFDSVNSNFKIKGFEGSYAQVYAGSNSITFVELPTANYTVSFNSEGGSVVGSVQADNDTLITAPIEPTKAGYTFAGWYKEAEYVNAWNFGTDKVTADITLFAKWTADQVIEQPTSNYTVTFDSEGGSFVGSVQAENDTLITAPTEPTKAGYTFAGWYKEAEYVNAWNFGTDKVTTDITLYAKWTADQIIEQPAINYTVTFDSEGGSAVGSVQADNDTLITAPIEPTKSGYTFAGWYKEAECLNAWNFGTDKVTTNVTLYAKWTAKPVTGVNLNKTTVNLKIGESTSLEETVNPTDVLNKDVTWSSSNTSVAIVDNTGKVSAIGKGAATITVKTIEGGYIANCIVNVVDRNIEVLSLIGSSRYDTAVKLSQSQFSTTDTIIIVNGGAMADGLGATPLAKYKNAPLLLTETNSLTDSTINEIKRLKAKKAIIVGGTGVVSDNVKFEIQALGLTVERISGSDRYSTSLEVAKYIDKNCYNVSKIVISNGYGEADALSIAPAAGRDNMPIILVEKDNISTATYSWLSSKNIENAYIIGGTGVVSNNVLNSIDVIVSGDIRNNRLGGKNRFETNSLVIDKFYGSVIDKTYIAKGYELIDALSAGSIAAINTSPVVLSDNDLDTSQKAVIGKRYGNIIIRTGGGISNTAVDSLIQCLQ